MASEPRPQRVVPGLSWPLYGVAATRALEHIALSLAAPHVLMQRAGLATARLCLALHPHADTFWVAAGPGNNGGDGLEAAARLRQQGKTVFATWSGDLHNATADVAASCRHALAAGVMFADAPPPQFDVCVDALLGIGANRAPDGVIGHWINSINLSGRPVLSVDIPTGLNADTGTASPLCVRAAATLCLLTLKPGLFTADGRDASQSVWLDDLGVDWSAPALRAAPPADASLLPAPTRKPAMHGAHKGSRGDVVVIGGATGMAGAAVLAGMAALHQGAGRVYLALLDAATGSPSQLHAELMLRDAATVDLSKASVVCGCGGGTAVAEHLPRVLSCARRLVLDADGLNTIASDNKLQHQLRSRHSRGWQTVLTPHPLEAARLLGCSSAEVQRDRCQTASRLARDYACVVVLKGSGTVIVAPEGRCAIVPVGNARLATAGTGDVLAGAIAAAMANGQSALAAAQGSAYRHARCADLWPANQTFTASKLAVASWC